MLFSPRRGHGRSSLRKGAKLLRRALFIGAVLAALFTAPGVTEAQVSGTVLRVGWLFAGPRAASSRDLFAKALGVTIPPSILVQADAVIQ